MEPAKRCEREETKKFGIGEYAVDVEYGASGRDKLESEETGRYLGMDEGLCWTQRLSILSIDDCYVHLRIAGLRVQINEIVMTVVVPENSELCDVGLSPSPMTSCEQKA